MKKRNLHFYQVLCCFLFSCSSHSNNLIISKLDKQGLSTLIQHYSGSQEVFNDTVNIDDCYCFTNDTTLFIHLFRNSGWTQDIIHIEIKNNISNIWIRKTSDIGGPTIKLLGPIKTVISNEIGVGDEIYGQINFSQKTILEESSFIIDSHGKFTCKLNRRDIRPNEFNLPGGKYIYSTN